MLDVLDGSEVVVSTLVVLVGSVVESLEVVDESSLDVVVEGGSVVVVVVG